jgi:hypothetical protein
MTGYVQKRLYKYVPGTQLTYKVIEKYHISCGPIFTSHMANRAYNTCSYLLT